MPAEKKGKDEQWERSNAVRAAAKGTSAAILNALNTSDKRLFTMSRKPRITKSSSLSAGLTIRCSMVSPNERSISERENEDANIRNSPMQLCKWRWSKVCGVYSGVCTSLSRMPESRDMGFYWWHRNDTGRYRC